MSFIALLLPLLLLLSSFQNPSWHSPSSGSFAKAFSRENREINIRFDTSGGKSVVISLDPFITTAGGLAKEACDAMGCIDTEEVQHRGVDGLHVESDDRIKKETGTQALEATLNYHLLLETYRHTRETYSGYREEMIGSRDNGQHHDDCCVPSWGAGLTQSHRRHRFLAAAANSRPTPEPTRPFYQGS